MKRDDEDTHIKANTTINKIDTKQKRWREDETGIKTKWANNWTVQFSTGEIKCQKRNKKYNIKWIRRRMKMRKRNGEIWSSTN